MSFQNQRNIPFNNKLILNYNQRQPQIVQGIYQNNPLLANNPHTTNAVVQQRVGTLRETQRIKELELNNQTVDPNQLKKIILGQEKVPNKIDVKEFNQHVSEMERKYDATEKEKLWKTRNNQPYKNFLPDIDYKKKYQKPEDLIVHKTSLEDKDEKKLENDVEKFNSKISEQNEELNIMYPENKKEEHKKTFQYNNVYKYAVKYDPADYDKLKEGLIEHYKQEQQKMEQDKQTVDDIVATMVTNKIITDEQAKSLEKTDIDQIDEDLKKELGEKYDAYMQEIKQAEEKVEKEVTIIDEIPDKGTNDTGIKTNEKVNKINDKKDKYRSRQKKTIV